MMKFSFLDMWPPGASYPIIQILHSSLPTMVRSHPAIFRLSQRRTRKKIFPTQTVNNCFPLHHKTRWSSVMIKLAKMLQQLLVSPKNPKSRTPQKQFFCSKLLLKKSQKILAEFALWLFTCSSFIFSSKIGAY